MDEKLGSVAYDAERSPFLQPAPGQAYLERRFSEDTAREIDLAERLGVNSGTASYHLRQLAAAGFVADDTERGNARERWWRSVHQATWFNDPDLARREPEAALTYLQSVAAHYTLRVQGALNELQTLPDAWRGAFDMSDWLLRLTPDEATRLRREVAAVVDRYRQDTPEGAAEAPDGAERVSLITHFLPEPGSTASPPA